MRTKFRPRSHLSRLFDCAGRYFLPLIGLSMMIFSAFFTAHAPYLVSAAMVLEGLFLLIPSLVEREYAKIGSNHTSFSIVLLICGVLVFVKRADCMLFLGTLWGLIGLYRGVEDLNEALYRLAHRQRCVFLLLETAFSIFLAVLLLYDPREAFRHHVVILGAELILSAILPEHREEIPA